MVVGIDANGNIFKHAISSSEEFKKMVLPQGETKAISISIGSDDTICIVGNDTKTGYKFNQGTNKWDSLAPAIKHISVGSGSYIYSIGMNDKIWYWYTIDNQWTLLEYYNIRPTGNVSVGSD